MSSQLTIYIHKIGEPITYNEDTGLTNMIELAWFTTTPTIQLYDFLPPIERKEKDNIYGTFYAPIDKNCGHILKEIDKFYANNIADVEKEIIDNKKLIEENNTLICKTTCIDIFDKLREDNDYINSSLTQLEQDKTMYESLRQDFINIANILEINNEYEVDDNKHIYELVYSVD